MIQSPEKRQYKASKKRQYGVTKNDNTESAKNNYMGPAKYNTNPTKSDNTEPAKSDDTELLIPTATYHHMSRTAKKILLLSLFHGSTHIIISSGGNK